MNGIEGSQESNSLDQLKVCNQLLLILLNLSYFYVFLIYIYIYIYIYMI